MKYTEIFLNQKNAKIMKRSHALMLLKVMKVLVIILNSFNLELQLKNTKSAIENKLIDLLSELKGFVFDEAIVLKFEKNRKWW